MTEPDETLSAIDAAIDGWNGYDGTVGPDAMRWAPAEPEPKWRGAELAGVTRDEVRLLDPPRPLPPTRLMTPEQMQDTLRGIGSLMRQQQMAFMRAFRTIAKAAGRTHASLAPLTYGDDYRRHRRCCRVCNPEGNPKPLKVDGADYARRRRNRRRRG